MSPWRCEFVFKGLWLKHHQTNSCNLHLFPSVRFTVVRDSGGTGPRRILRPGAEQLPHECSGRPSSSLLAPRVTDPMVMFARIKMSWRWGPLGEKLCKVYFAELVSTALNPGLRACLAFDAYHYVPCLVQSCMYAGGPCFTLGCQGTVMRQNRGLNRQGKRCKQMSSCHRASHALRHSG